MKAGRLRHIVDVETFTESQDSAGQPIQVWAPYARRWADVHNLRGSELWAAQERFATVTTMVSMRWFAGLVSTMRIQHKGVIYDILYVDNVDLRNVEYIVWCQTGLKAEGG